MGSPCCIQPLEITCDFFDPLRPSWRADGESYRKNPDLARFKWVVINTFRGFFMPILFPLWAAVGAIVMPIIAFIQACRGKTQEARGWLGAWCFSLLGVAGSIIFLTLSVKFLPMNVAAAAFMAAIVLSISIHVWRACCDPRPPLPHHAPVRGLVV